MMFLSKKNIKISNKKWSKERLEDGLTIIELLVVIAIIGLLSYNLISSVLRTRINIYKAARVVIADIRTAQANALSSKQYNGTNRCGYGVAEDSSFPDRYFIYASNPTVPNNPDGCNGNWKYNTAQDTPVIFTRILDPRLELFDPNGNPRPNFYDITFEPYNGNIRIDNLHMPSNQNQNLSQIAIRKKGVTTCTPDTCIYVCVYAFGRIQTRSTECALCQGDPLTCPN
jgi:prepilin-type N-terminal cleavage/methylation domain-containing protein